ncbi:MAG TPA: acyl-CoA dehydrogenase family protein [Steroidobacteraceae bacterium]|nr:acyl-CoA dehydrogenase family protein [Steroidobacteraceae bacterium]
MDFTLNTEQVNLRDSVQRYCRSQCAFDVRRHARAHPGTSPLSHWREFARLGWLGAALPAELGGSDGAIVDDAIIMEELGRSLVLEPFLQCGIFASQLLNAAGTLEQRKILIPQLIGGELTIAVAVDLSDDDPWAHFSAITARPPISNQLVLHGGEALVHAAMDVNHIVIPARTEFGPTLFLIRSDAPGVNRKQHRTIDGLDCFELTLDGVIADQGDVIGSVGCAYLPLDYATDYVTTALCAEAIGAMNGLLTITRDHLKQRRQYGASLSTYQALQHRMADMFADLELARSMLYAAIAAILTPNVAARRRTVFAAKAYISESGRSLGQQAIQLHGASGMTDDSKAAHYFRRLVVIAGCAGERDFLREQVAAALLD